MRNMMVYIVLIVITTLSDTTLVVIVPNTSNYELYKRCEYWVSTTYTSSNTIDYKSENAMILKPSLKSYPSTLLGSSIYNGYLHYIIEIQFKDNKYKLHISDFSYTHPIHKWKIQDICNNDGDVKKMKGRTNRTQLLLWRDLISTEQSIIIKSLSIIMNTSIGMDTDW